MYVIRVYIMSYIMLDIDQISQSIRRCLDGID